MLAATSLLFAACGGSDEQAAKKRVVIGVPAILGTHPFYVQQNSYFKAEAKRLGVELKIVDSAPGGKVNETRLLDDANAMLQSGVDALIFEYINANPWIPFAKQAEAKGVCLINQSQTPLTGASANWGEENYPGGHAVGVAAGKWAQAHRDTAPKLAVIVRPDNPPLQARTKGFIEGVRSVVPSAEVVAEADALDERATASAFANMASAHPDASIFFAPDIDPAVAGLAALKEAGLVDPDKIFVGANNVSENGLDVLASRKTPLQATYMYSKNNLASVQMFRDAVACARGKEIPPTATMEGSVVTVENLPAVQQMLVDLKAPGPLPRSLEKQIEGVITYDDKPKTTPTE
jgi:ABC-type sugar transport system substrate-binding protein